jgi:tetratricopeptide (TPR) repeat protein
VEFEISCGDGTQKTFEYGVAMLHHMMYEQSREVFTGLTETDPFCSMAWWGIAMTYLHPLWAPPSKEELAKGLRAVTKAEGLNPATDRERAYVAAIKAFYQDYETVKHPERIARWEAGQEKVYRGWPDDINAAAFYSLSHLATAPKADKTFAHQVEAGRILEGLNAKAPKHPAGFHYLIHAYDNPMLAEKAVKVARGYDDIAPSVPHALHMPTHIFVRLGFWEDVAHWNRRSADAAWKQSAGGVASLHYAHAMDYMVYANAQVGNDEAAKAALDELSAKKTFQDSFASAYAIAAAQARYPLERSSWAEAAELTVRTHPDFPWDKYPWFEAITHFARGLGAARSGDAKTARESVRILDTIYDKTVDAGQSYWAVLVDSQRKTVSAWAAFADGQKDEALALMAKGADLEDSVDKHPVTPGAVLPARELFGDMLTAIGRYFDAIEAYKASLAISANRFKSLYGAGRAAELAGKKETAMSYYSRLVELAARTSKRPELGEARGYLGR